MNSREWIIVIPSYKRQDIIMEKSLATLKRYHVPPSNIAVVVANQEEKKLYEEAIPKGTVKDIIVGVPGLDKVRNYILDYFPKGKRLVMMDDDIRGFNQRTKGRKIKTA
jgi:cellulose synthase/poly-beta-1,6-N-acetylglucosamine synthase-like glycosyltransferase